MSKQRSGFNDRQESGAPCVKDDGYEQISYHDECILP